jgi:hypothetical protein
VPDSFDWTPIINAALLWYQQRQGSKAPNFYTAPQTPTEQWRVDASKDLYSTASDWSKQFMSGLGNLNPSTNIGTTRLGDPSFMGGIKLPQIDTSRMHSPVPITDTGKGGTPTGGVGTEHPFGGQASGLGGAPIGGGSSFPTSGNSGGVDWSDPHVQSVAQWIAAHPAIAKGGTAAVTAALGPVAGAVAGLILNWIGGHGGMQGLPSSGTSFTGSDLAPGGKKPSLDTPYGDWFAPVPPTPPNSTPFNPQYAGGAGPGYYDPKGGAAFIGNLLGGQMNSGDGRGPKKF